MASKFTQVISQIAEEKGIPKETVIETIEAALAAAFRKDYGEKDQNVKVEFNPETGDIRVFDEKTVVEKIDEEDETSETNHKEFITVADAVKLQPDAEVGDVLRTEITPKGSYGRIAAQTAKQVIIQRIREAERKVLLEEFAGKEHEIVNGTVQRIERNNVFVDLGRTTGVLFPSEQIRGERYGIGQRLKVYISEVKETPKGPEIVVSRAHPNMVKKLFELEVPEIYSGVVEIKALAREAGSRTKVAVYTTQDGVDPIGSCVGQRGTRVQTIIAELSGEKIDIILWDPDPVKFITNALAPAKVVSVVTKEKEKEAIVEVNEDQMSLAIGKAGQNVRLAAKLSGWKIDVVKAEPIEEVKEGAAKEEAAQEEVAEPKAEEAAPQVAEEAKEAEAAPEEKDSKEPKEEKS